MATKRFSILGSSINLDNTGSCVPRSSTMDFTSTGLYKNTIMAFTNAGGQRHGFYGVFCVPKDYVGSAAIVPVWGIASAESNAVAWDFEYVAVGGDSSESLDPAAATESLTIADSANGTARLRNTASISLTSSNLAADDTVLFGFFRDSTDAADTMANSVFLFDLLFEYSNS